MNLHFYPYLSDKQEIESEISGHLDNLKNLMSHARVWITEFGNINPLSMAGTLWLLSDILRGFEGTRAEKWHYLRGGLFG